MVPGGQRLVPPAFADLGHGAAQVQAREARRDGHVCRRSSRCSSSCPGFSISATCDSLTVPPGARSGSSTRIVLVPDAAPVHLDPDADHAVALEHRGGVAPSMAVLTAAATSRRSGRALRVGGAHAKADRGPGVDQAVQGSTTPGTFLSCSATSGAFLLRNSHVVREELDLDRLGDHVKSPIRSLRMPGNSQSMRAAPRGTLCRSSAMTSSVLRWRSGLSFTGSRPCCGSAMASAKLRAGAPRIALDLGGRRAGSPRPAAASGRSRSGWCRAA